MPRQGLAVRDAVVLKDEISLFPGVPVEVGVAAFDAAADAALNRDPPPLDACAAAIALFRGELLPDDLNEPWTRRDRLRLVPQRACPASDRDVSYGR